MLNSAIEIENRLDPKVSVIVNVYNGEKYIQQTLEKILNQSFVDFEVIILNNCSTDSTVDIISRFDDDRLAVHNSERLIPLYSARNLAISKANGKFIAFCDADDLWFPTKLEEQVCQMEKSGNMLGCTNFLTLSERDGAKKYSWVSDTLPKHGNYDLLLNHPYIHMSSFIVERRLFLDFDIQFNPNLTILGDMDFFVRALEFSNICVINNFLTIYRFHDENTGFIRFDEIYKEGLMLISQYRQLDSVDIKSIDNFEKRINWFHIRQKLEKGEKVSSLQALNVLKFKNIIKFFVILMLPKFMIPRLKGIKRNI